MRKAVHGAVLIFLSITFLIAGLFYDEAGCPSLAGELVDIMYPDARAGEGGVRQDPPRKGQGEQASDTEEVIGKNLFEKVCSPCHRFDMRLVGPPLDRVLPKYNGDVERLAQYIRAPVKVDPDYPPMPRPFLNESEIAAVARYLMGKGERVLESEGKERSFLQPIPGTVLRKASGRLVLSLGSFEIGERKAAEVRHRNTGEEMTVRLSSVYEDSSYTVVLDRDIYSAIEAKDYECYVLWEIPGDMESMEEFLFRIHEYQNSLRKRLGAEVTATGQFVSSRIVLGKLQKFHKIGANIVRKFFERGRKSDRYDLFRFPITFEIGFSPDIVQAYRGSVASYEKSLMELIYEEFGRTLWFEYGFGEDLIDIIFNAPLTVKNFSIRKESEHVGFFVPAPYIRVPPDVLNAAWYIYRQDIVEEVGRKIKLSLLKDSMIYDRTVLKRAFTTGWTIGTMQGSLILSFTSPYVKPGDTVYVTIGGSRSLPVKVSEVDRALYYSVTEPLAPQILQQIRMPSPVRLYAD